MIKMGHKIRLNPTPEQEKYFIQACHAARVVWNWALAKWNSQYEAGMNPTAFKLKKEFNAIKYEQYYWVCEVSKSVSEGAFRDLGKAFSHFFKNPEHFGRPKFKKKGKCQESFYLANDQFRISGHKVRIPKMDIYTGHQGKQAFKWVDMFEELRFEGKIIGARISRQAGRWYISVQVDTPRPQKATVTLSGSVGVDLGISRLATFSTGDIIENIKAIRQYQKRLTGLSKQLSRREKGSSNWEKTKLEIQRIHERIANRRHDHIHKMTAYLTSNYAFISIEDLNVQGLLKNRRLSKAIADASWGEIGRQIEYKAQRYGGDIKKVGRFFPSSKTCSRCGTKKHKIKLSERTYICRNPECGMRMDRDLNAALNILKEGLRLSLSLTESSR